MYNPKKYWAARKILTSDKITARVEKYFKKHTKKADTILDFGIGVGRMLYLYGDKKVTGYDIVKRELPLKMIYSLSGRYDVIICSKVLLHIKPESIEKTILALKKMAYKIMVYDTVAECRADHNFNHDFKKYGKMNDVIIDGKHLLFYYKGERT